MKTIKLPSNVGQLFITGDIHGEFKELFHNLKNKIRVKDEDMEYFLHPMEQENNKRLEAEAIEIEERMRTGYRPSEHEYQIYTTYRYMRDSKKKNKQTCAYSNSAIIVAGDCGFGFNKKGYYTDLLEKYNKILQYNNTYVFFVRGNHDDPSYFDGEMVNYSNIKAVEDYTIIEVIGNRILCVGGAISCDRTWRFEQEKRINRFKVGDSKKKLYWPGENVVFDKNKILEALKDGAKVDIVITHSAPSFVEPQDYSGIEKWIETDKELRKDVDNERITHDRIFETLRDNDSRPKLWVHGHFDYSSEEKRTNTYFISLEDGFKPLNVGAKMAELFNVTITKKAPKKNGKVVKKLSSEYLDLMDVTVGVPNNGQPMNIGQFRPDAFRIDTVAIPDEGRDAPNLEEEAIDNNVDERPQILNGRATLGEEFQRMANEYLNARVEHAADLAGGPFYYMGDGAANGVYNTIELG